MVLAALLQQCSAMFCRVFFGLTAAPVFLTQLQNQEVPDGYPVNFDCVIIGKPSPSIRWFKDGKVLHEDDHYMINEDQEGCHQLIITTVRPSDMGVYRCVAENDSGIASSKAELRVESEYTGKRKWPPTMGRTSNWMESPFLLPVHPSFVYCKVSLCGITLASTPPECLAFIHQSCI